MSSTSQNFPRARRQELAIHAMDGELLLYDHALNQAHVLNAAAAFVWRASDGNRSVDDIAQAMTREFGMPADAQVVWYALEQLNKKRLLETTLETPLPLQGLSRRQFLKRATAAAILLAAIASIAAPSSAHAQGSCGPLGC
ncbi:MAG: hypothetical protein BroJett039_03170 [Chloroflexota bacterium]|nr:MAG: hypothetical protein BroJett039_03170 [Chloroflexota bacterium]